MDKILNAIKSAAKTTAKWFYGVLVKAQKDAPAVQAIADRIHPWAKMVVDGVLVAEGGGAITPEANLIMDEINKDIDVACTALFDVGPTPTVVTFFQSLGANITGLITAGHVKNPANVTLIQNVVASLLSLVGISPAAATSQPAS